jgi:hypothetical protein
MNQYSFLQEYRLSKALFATAEIKTIMKFRHHFYTPYGVDLPMAYERLNPFPCELKTFYEEIGFGFMHCRKGEINRILDPVSLVIINLLEGEFRYDKRICGIVERHDIENRLLFFESQSGKFLSIERRDVNGRNAIYNEKHKVADSLYEFIRTYHNNINWLEAILD